MVRVHRLWVPKIRTLERKARNGGCAVLPTHACTLLPLGIDRPEIAACDLVRLSAGKRSSLGGRGFQTQLSVATNKSKYFRGILE
jgi:hypothetical protein